MRCQALATVSGAIYNEFMTEKTVTHNRKRATSTAIPLELKEFLCFSVYSAGHAFNRVYQPLLKELNLTYPQFIALILLWEQDAQTVGELGEKLFLQSNTLTPMLKRLETLGLIKRSRDAADERQVHINLTESGRKLRSRAGDIVRSVRKAMSLSDEQVKDLKQGVDALRSALNNQNDDPMSVHRP
jgi:MarR family transcriptional regulator, organic hydroperoxide resistance regulator